MAEYMHAFVFTNTSNKKNPDLNGELRLNHPKPVPKENEVLIKTLRAGICKTDLEILKGYAGPGFAGHVIGHEFVGEIVGHGGDSKSKVDFPIGTRVCGEINLACENDFGIVGCEEAGAGGAAKDEKVQKKYIIKTLFML